MSGARVEPGSVLGEGCLIGAHAEVRGDVKVYPYKVVEAGAQVNASIVWESGGARALFGREGVQGIANVDVSPELAVRLAKAWASGFEKGSFITASRDTSRVARVLKRALMVGCNSVGVNVADLELATIPVTRHHIRVRGNRAGLTVRLSPDDPQQVVIRFFDDRGIDLSEGDQRRVERMYHREEFRRVTAGEIGDIDFSPRTIEHYTADVVEAFGLRRDADRVVKLVLDLSYGAASFVMPNLLSKVGADVLSINPFAQTPAMLAVDRHESEARVAEAVRSSGADLGAVIDAGGEKLTLIDNRGHVLSDDEALMAFLELTTAGGATGPVALPVTVSDRALRLCEARGIDVILTPLSPSGVLEAAASGRRVVRLGPPGRLRLPRLPPGLRRRRGAGPPDLATRAGHHLAGRGGRGHPGHADVARGGADAARAQGPDHAHHDGAAHRRGSGAGPGRRHKGDLRRRLGAGGPGPRGPGHPRLGRGGPPGGVGGTGGGLCGPHRVHGSLADGPAGRVGGPVGSGPVNVPEELRYSEEHEWVRVEGTRVRIGITDYAQDALGDIVFVDLPAVGSEVEVGGQLGEVESTKSVSEIYAPLSGTVTAVNDALAGGPERINQDPYGEGWICELELAPGADPGGLLDAAAYGELIAG